MASGITGLFFCSTQVLAENTTEIGGVLMLDYSAFDGVYLNDDQNDVESDVELRRARVDLKHRMNDDWQAKLQINFDEEDSSSEIGDAYIRYSGLNGVNLTFGKMKEPFGLENQTSSKNITFLERSMATNAFAPGRNKGIEISGSPSAFTWSFGAYDVDLDDDEDSNAYAATGRLTWAVFSSQEQTLHLGLAGSWRDLDGGEFEIDERSEVHSSEKIISSGDIETDTLQLVGLEAAWVNGPLSIQSEYMSTDIQAVDRSEDGTFDGYYLQTSYFLTGESRRYKNGIFSKVKPMDTSGAWELTARYSVLNTRESSEGNKGETSTLGVNYYYDKNIRIMANLLHSEVEQEVDGEGDGNAISMRLQYVF